METYSCKELLKQWRIVNNSDCLVCKEKENYKHFYFDCKYNKKYWQEVKKITTNLYIGDHAFNPGISGFWLQNI